jgi:hypothetical protein
MKEDIKAELMERFEDSVEASGLDMDLNTNHDGYTDKLTVIAYHFFIEGTKKAEKILLMESIENQDVNNTVEEQ